MDTKIINKILDYFLLFAFISLIILLFTGCTRYQGTSTRILDDLEVNYEITNDIPHYPNADAVYVEEEDKIYVKRGRQQVYLVIHELVHKIRINNKVFLGWEEINHKMEEAIAVRSAVNICKIAGIRSGVGRYQIEGLISRTWKINGLNRKALTREQNDIVNEQVAVTVGLFAELLRSKGHNLKDVDWARTAILLLL